MNELIHLLKQECEFIWNHSDEFEQDLCYGFELINVSFNDENIYVKMCDMDSGQHIGNSYSIQEYLDWKNKITSV